MDLEKFTEAFSRLINISRHLLKKDLNKKNMVLQPFNNYCKAYMKDSEENAEEIHMKIVSEAFLEIFPKIDEEGDDDWLRHGLMFDYGTVGKRKYVIYVSSIYSFALKCKEQTEQQISQKLVGMKRSERESLMNKLRDKFPELDYPEEFQLILSRLALSVCDDESYKSVLERKINYLEIELGYVEAPEQKQVDNTNQGGGIMDLFKPFIDKISTGIPGANAPSGADVGNIVNSLFNNETAKQVLGDMFNDVKGCKSVGQVINKLVDKMEDPKLKEVISTTLESTTAQKKGKETGSETDTEEINPSAVTEEISNKMSEILGSIKNAVINPSEPTIDEMVGKDSDVYDPSE